MESLRDGQTERQTWCGLSSMACICYTSQTVAKDRKGKREVMLANAKKEFESLCEKKKFFPKFGFKSLLQSMEGVKR